MNTHTLIGLKKASFGVQVALLIGAVLSIIMPVALLMIQFAVGVIQIAQNLFVLTHYHRLTTGSQKDIRTYWILVGVFVILIGINAVLMYFNVPRDLGFGLGLFSWIIFPWIIAVYNVRITHRRDYTTQTIHHRHQFLDNVQL